MTTHDTLTTTQYEELRSIEKIGAGASKHYVPIYTSDFVKSLDGAFSFSGVKKYSTRGSRHAVRLSSKDRKDLSIYIENSYDRTLSLRLSFEFKNFIFGFVRQVHMGSSAKGISENTAEVSEMYLKAADVVQTLSMFQFSGSEKLEIFKVALTARGIKSFSRVKNILDYVEQEDTSAMHFIDRVLNLIYVEGIELYTKKGIKLSRPMKSQFHKILVSKKIYETIIEKYPELCL